MPAYGIAERLGIHANTVTRMVAELRLPSRKRQVDVPRLFRMWTEGVAREVICHELGVSSQQLSVLKQQHKLPARPKKPASLAPDPTPEQIAERAAACRERHMAQRRAEDVSNTYSKVSKWRAGICQPR